MPITTNHQIWTPNDTDAWDLVIDLGAMAVSIDAALGRISGESRVNVVPSAASNFTSNDFLLIKKGGVAYATGQFGRTAGSPTLSIGSAYTLVATFDSAVLSRGPLVIFPGLGTTNIAPGLEARIIPVAGNNMQLQVRATSGTVQIFPYSSIGLNATWLTQS